MDMGRPKNTIMMSTPGPYGYRNGGMFTIVKIRPHITSYEDPGLVSSARQQ